MRQLFKEATVITAINFFPFTANFHKDIQRGLSVIGAGIFPVALSMGLPVFLYLIVLEKE